jgi:4-alpha-glucanotransferase
MTQSRAGRALPGDRRAGVLLHPTSLPGYAAHGDIGQDAFDFIEFMLRAGLRVWQMLPLGPTHADGSPYQCTSAHAGNTDLISLSRLREWGWLDASEAASAGGRGKSRATVLAHARRIFSQSATAAEKSAYEQFRQEQSAWLDDYVLYQSLRREHASQPWWSWPVALRDRAPAALAGARARLTEELEQARFEQFVFFRQWRELRHYANAHGITLFGDVPIFVAHDSADVWTQRKYFLLDDSGHARFVAGVPPDYFSATGQRWGNPLYDWERLQRDGFVWWLDRVRTQLQLFDLVRIDHFRGFEAYWEIPGHEQTAVNGRWVRAPGEVLFDTMLQQLGVLPLVAEDLGVITPEVIALRDRYDFPGMRILQFAFEGGPDNPFLPHNYCRNTVVYTGTHDNDTTLSWFNSQTPELQQAALDYLGHPREAMPWPLMCAALASVADLAVLPMQDILGLGDGHRMNFPGTTQGNWQWRFSWDQVGAHLANRLHHLVRMYGRIG